MHTYTHARMHTHTHTYTYAWIRLHIQCTLSHDGLVCFAFSLYDSDGSRALDLGECCDMVSLCSLR